MKNTRKLIPALAMLLVSAVMMSTASFAWFSMNKQVTATGLLITANSDNVWLVINAGSNFDKTNKETSATSNAEAKSLYPVAPATTITSTNVTTAGSWHFAYSDAVDEYQKADDTEYITCTSLTQYVASETFSIGLSEISGSDKAYNLMLTAVNLPEDTGISVVVVCGDKAYTHRENGSSLNQKLADEVTKTGVVVTVYYFIDGDNANVYMDNKAALTGNVGLVFDIGSTQAPQAPQGQ